MTWCVLDLETTIGSAQGRKASPFHAPNWIVMAGWQHKGQARAEGKRFAQPQHPRHDEPAQWFIDLLATPGLRTLVGANIGFDITYLITRSPESLAAWMQFVARGGGVWDVLLAEFVLNGGDQASQAMSLNECAARYGTELKHDEVGKLWAAGIDTPDIDPDLLSAYLIGADLRDPFTGGITGYREGDIGITKGVFLQQLQATRKLGMGKLMQLEMGALLCSIEMERNGLFVDVPLAMALRDKLASELATKTKELVEYLPKDLPFQFNWTNRYHLSPIIFGGRIKYERREYSLKDGTTTWQAPHEPGLAKLHFAYAQKDATHYVLEDGSTMDCLWWEHCYHTEHGFADDEGKSRVKYKNGKNAGEYKTKKVKVDDYDKPKSRMAEDYWAFPQLVKPKEEWASSTPGLYSTASEVMDELLEGTSIPFLKVLAWVRAASKDLGTYFLSEDGQSGMLTKVGPDALVHHRIHHNRTVTGRFAASDPNSQNFPRGDDTGDSGKYSSPIKQVFRSRFEDGKFISSDFSSLEIYVQAILTGDKNLIADLKAGYDMHCVRLAAGEKMEYEAVLRLAKGDKATGLAPDPIWEAKRTKAKIASFRRAYGAGVASIAAATGMTLEEAQAFVDGENARYPSIDRYLKALEKQVAENAEPSGTVVAHPDNPAVAVRLLKSWSVTPDGKRYTYVSSPSSKYDLKRGISSTFSPTQRANFQIQGAGAQWMKMAMWLLIREFYARGNLGGRALLINTVHDAAYVDAAPDAAEQAAAMLDACMWLASEALQQHHSWAMPLLVPTDTNWGPTWAEEAAIKSDTYPAIQAATRAALRLKYLEKP